MAYRLVRGEPLGKGLRRCAEEELEAARRHLTDGLAADPVAAVHEARKSLKKERALLRLAHGSLDGRVRRHADRELRDAGRRLAGARDADVMPETLAALADPAAGRVPAGTLDRLRAVLEQRRAAVRADALHDATTRALAATLERLGGELAGALVDAEGWDVVAGGLRRTHERGRAALVDACAHPDVEHRHELRKRVKDLWYHRRLLECLWPEVLGAEAAQAHELSDILGHDHDLAALAGLLHGERGPAAGLVIDLDPLLAVIAVRREQLGTAGLALGRRLYAEQPKAVVRRLEAYWRA